MEDRFGPGLRVVGEAPVVGNGVGVDQVDSITAAVPGDRPAGQVRARRDRDPAGTRRLRALHEPGQGRPSRGSADGAGGLAFRVVEQVLDDGVVRADQQRLHEAQQAARPAGQQVLDPRALARGRDGELMVAVDTAGRVEREAHAAAGFVLGDAVADRAVPAGGADRERAVEPHRGPRGRGPQAVVVPAEPGQERGHGVDGGFDLADMDVVDHPAPRQFPYATVWSSPYGTVWR
ncbi:hypothetical protein GCM10029992_10810 [Glycomyces albus]